MADAGVVRDGSRLPWLEPYRAPPRRKSNRRPGIAAAIGLAGLAGVVTLLTRDMIPMPVEQGPPQVETVLPAPQDLQPAVVLPELRPEPQRVASASPRPAATPRRASQPKRRITATPTNAAYREVLQEQSADEAAVLATAQAAVAIAALPLPPDPPRPAVNPAARVVRGKTVQLGVFRTQQQAEFAWRSAIRDYTYLVTMPKSIEAISIRSKRFYRLQLGTPSRSHARQLCSNLKSIGRACTVA
jgi:hypothetical protein